MIYYKSGYKYQLTRPYSCTVSIWPQSACGNEYVSINPHGMLYISKGYAWDGPSGPSIDTKTFMRGSLVHDALYQLIRERHLNIRNKEAADRELRKICLEDGMNWVRAWYVYQAVSMFGGIVQVPRKEECAP